MLHNEKDNNAGQADNDTLSAQVGRASGFSNMHSRSGGGISVFLGLDLRHRSTAGHRSTAVPRRSRLRHDADQRSEFSKVALARFQEC